jgi:hypothetical protein
MPYDVACLPWENLANLEFSLIKIEPHTRLLQPLLKCSDKYDLRYTSMSEQAESTVQESSEKSKSSASPGLPGPVLRSGEPNQMVYKDDEGVQQAIWIPLGQLQLASQHFMNKDWVALRQFPQVCK